MAFLAQRFPDNIARGASGGPGYSTTVVESIGGAESRTGNWPVGRHKYNVSQGIKDEADANLATAYFRKARGRLHAFRFKDWSDYRLLAAASRLLLVSGTTYQLAKVYGADEPGFEEVRPLTRLVAGTLQVWSGATLLTAGVDYTADIDTGRITSASPTLSAACEFDVPCRFDFDQKDATLVHRRPDGSLLIDWSDIDIIEVPGDE